MDFHELEAFIALSRCLHFARAAASMHTSPSGLSRLLSRLEDELGARLFERDTRRVELTAEGETFLAFATESLHRREELRLRLGTGDGLLRGFLKVYASVTACYSILPPFATALAARHPELRLSVETGDPAGAVEALREGRAELAVAALPAEGFSDLDCFSVRRTPLVLASASDGPFGNLDLDLDSRIPEALPSGGLSPAARISGPISREALPSGGLSPATRISGPISRGLSLADQDARLKRVLSSVPLILPRTGHARERLDGWSRERNFKPQIAAETAGNEALLALARLGLGLALVPRLVLENGPFAEGLVLYEAGPAFGDYDIGFVLHASGSGSESARRLRFSIGDLLPRTYPEGSWRSYNRAKKEKP